MAWWIIGIVLAGVLFALLSAWRRRPRVTLEAGLDSHGDDHDPQQAQAAEHETADAPANYADQAEPPSVRWRSAEHASYSDVLPRPSDPVATGSRPALLLRWYRLFKLGASIRWRRKDQVAGGLRWTYDVRAEGTVNDDLTSHEGSGALPPAVADELRKVVTGLRIVSATLPPDSARPRVETRSRLLADTARRAPGWWPIAVVPTEDEDLPGETARFAVVFTPGSTDSTDIPPTRAAAPGADPAENRQAALAPVPVAHQTGHARKAHAKEPEKRTGSQTILLVDTAVLDVVLAAVLGPPHPLRLNYNEVISVIKVGIRPRTLMIKSVTMTMGALLNAHGLGLLAPACGRVVTRFLVPALDLVLGPDPRHDRLMKILDGVEIALYAKEGLLTDSPTFRSRFDNLVAEAGRGTLQRSPIPPVQPTDPPGGSTPRPPGERNGHLRPSAQWPASGDRQRTGRGAQSPSSAQRNRSLTIRITKRSPRPTNPAPRPSQPRAPRPPWMRKPK